MANFEYLCLLLYTLNWRLVDVGSDLVYGPFIPIEGRCEILLTEFAEIAANVTACAATHSIPPRICLQCADNFAHLDIAFYQLKNEKFKSADGEPCFKRIFDSYEFSYANSIYNGLKSDVWEASKCENCLRFLLSPSKEHRHDWVEMNSNAKEFFATYQHFVNCTSQFYIRSNRTYDRKVCDVCSSQYEEINNYYDRVFFHKTMEFCVDIQSIMNDTVRWWRDQQVCQMPAYPVKAYDNVPVGILCGLVFAAPLVFYALGFAIGKRQKRKLKKYRRIGGTFSSAVVNSNESLHRTPSRETVRPLKHPPSTRPKRVISFSSLPPSGLG